MFNEEMFKQLIMEGVAEALKNQNTQEYEGLWSVNDFKEKTNISEWDLRNKVLKDREFQKHIRRFEDSRKIYIDVAGAKKWLQKNMEVGLY